MSGTSRERWLAARERETPDTSYFHVVFTVPHELNVFALEDPRLFYDLLFTASAQTLLEIASDPKHLGAEIGVIGHPAHLGRTLLLHPHIHCVVPARGSRRITVDGSARAILSSYPSQSCFSWQVPGWPAGSYSVPVRLPPSPTVSSSQNSSAVSIATTGAVDTKPAFGGPMQVLRYLGRYTHRVAISNHRLLAFDQERVTFRWKDYTRGGKQGEMTLSAALSSCAVSARLAQRLLVRIRSRLSRQIAFGRCCVGPTTAGLQWLDRACS